MSQKWREKAILGAIETEYGKSPGLTGAHAVLAKDVELRPLETEAVQRGLDRPFLGADEDIFTGEHVGMSFKVELAASGTKGVAPAWGPLLRACGFAEIITPDTKVEYVLATGSYESVALEFFMGTNLHPLLGAYGEVGITLEKGIPYLTFDFKGLFSTPSTKALPKADFSNWKKPVTLGPGKTTDFSLHGHAGIPYKLSLSLGNEVVFDENLVSQKIEIADRNGSGSITIEAPKNSTINFFDRTLKGATGPLAIKHGAQGGNRISIDCPNVQVKAPKYAEQNKKAALEMGLGLLPVAGNDEIKITID